MSSVEETSECDQLLVAAFDFGTTYSGYAFSFRDKPGKIQTNMGWNAGAEKLISLKTPTCVLVNPQKEFVAFGYDAENKYSTLAEDNKHEGWMLFRRFKMLLHSTEKLKMDSSVVAINGQTMPAMTIFAMAISYLRDHLLNALNTSQLHEFVEKDIEYVITVPAIWNDKAKQFMREAAIKAGMDTRRVKLALEPEAASIWCQHVTGELEGDLSKVGNQYMVLDLGGGTADISVHEKKADDTLKEIHKASGGPWGGNAVDQNYVAWLSQLFGTETMELFKKKEMADYFDLHREFEVKKRNILPDTEGLITFRVSASMNEIHRQVDGKDIKERLEELGLAKKVTFRGDKLRIDAAIAKEWFQRPINGTVDHIKSLFAESKMENVGIILLVGGFGECQLVQKALRDQMSNKKLVVPEEAGLAVLKGTVRFGHHPKMVTSRVLRFTYGISSRKSFDETKHPASKKKIVDGEAYIYNTFSKFVEVNKEIEFGKPVEKPFTPTTMDATLVKIYTSPEPNPAFVTDKGCEKIGSLRIEHPEGKTFKDKKFNVYFEFGETELRIKIKVIKSGKEFYKSLDCL